MFSPKNKGLIPNKLPNYDFFFWMPQLMWCRIITHSLLNRVIQEKYKIFPEICEKMSKNDVFNPKIDSFIQQMSKLYFDTNAVALYVRKVEAIYILVLQCKKYWIFPEIGDFSLFLYF